MKRLFLLAASFVASCGWSAPCAEIAHWIWHPGDFEIYLAQQAQASCSGTAVSSPFPRTVR